MMQPSVIVWDLETVPDLAGFAAANDLVGKSEVEVREAIGDKFPKHIYHSIVCIGALVAHWEPDHWAVDTVGAPHVGGRTEKELITAFCDKLPGAEGRLAHSSWDTTLGSTTLGTTSERCGNSAPFRGVRTWVLEWSLSMLSRWGAPGFSSGVGPAVADLQLRIWVLENWVRTSELSGVRARRSSGVRGPRKIRVCRLSGAA
jgi:hypothetical protein